MASIHITEIQKILSNRGELDAEPWNNSGEGYFLEIRFDNLDKQSRVVAPEYKDKVLSVESAYGSVIIQFDQQGLLRSIDLS